MAEAIKRKKPGTGAKIADGLTCAYGWVLWVLTALILAFLSLVSIVYMPFIGSAETEITFFYYTEPKTIALSALLIAIACAAAMLYHKKLATKFKIPFKALRWILLIALLLVAVVWVLLTQTLPLSDTLFVYEAAELLSEGNYEAFAPAGTVISERWPLSIVQLEYPAGYLDAYPHQIGLVWFEYLLGCIFGYKNPLPMQFVNCIAIVVIYERLSAIGGKMGLGEAGQLFVLICAFLFYPFIIYVSFMYANLIGLALALVAVGLQIDFIKTHRVRFAVFAAICIALSVILKSNYLVFLIAMVMVSIICALKQKSIFVLLIAALSLGFYFGAHGAIMAYTRNLTGCELDEGVPSLSYISMGLNDGWRAEGWHDSTNQIDYVVAGLDSQKASEIARTRIGENIEKMKTDPAYAIRFFVMKEVSQWCNPDFEGYWLVQVRDSQIDQSEFIKTLYSTDAQLIMRPFLKAFQIFIFVMAFIACFTQRKRFLKEPVFSFLALAFVGGFICHTFWEAKCQYTVPYFVLLFPYAVLGLRDISARLCKLTSRTHKAGKHANNTLE